MNLRKALHFIARERSPAFARHGLDYVAGSLGLQRFAAIQKLFGHAAQQVPFTQPEHLRMALEEMGTTFIKLGQSSRPAPIYYRLST